ncbi:hypothetical protein F5B20DRAFT_542597 [Whalleya microplaca]|nr:hypothetical protein F5B20DRAFT_542597 [Whalleya microplaca]
MTPPCRVFPASQLETEIQTNEFGKRRKAQGGGRRIDLSACELLSLVQHDCVIDRPEISNSPVYCWPVQRWYRRCQDQRGSFMVETTMWEGRKKEKVTTPPPPVKGDAGEKAQVNRAEAKDGRLG